jgi:hypothetical protein
MKTSNQKKANVTPRSRVELRVILPIEDIIDSLKKYNFSTQDIPYLEGRLNEYLEMAPSMTVYESISHDKFTSLNVFTRAKYIEYFTILKEFFIDNEAMIEI